MKKISILITLALFFPIFCVAVPKVGEVPSVITLDGDLGGRVTGEAWSSSELNGKVYSLFYVDPDESDINKAMENAISDRDYPNEKFATVAVINMDATWLPNMAISAKLKSSQEDYPNTIYVKDMEKTLVKKWGLKDNDYDVVVFGPDGKVIYVFQGVLSESDIQEMIEAIESVLP